MTANTPPTASSTREARLRALEAAQGVAFRHFVARLRGDLLPVLGCRLMAIDAEGGRIELLAVSEEGERTFAELGVTLPDDRRGWFPFLSVAALVAKRKGSAASAAPPPSDHRTS